MVETRACEAKATVHRRLVNSHGLRPASRTSLLS